jgi:hypothetical protein
MYTTDRTDPRLGHGVDESPRPQNEAYLVLDENELAKGYVRPLRRTYLHVGLEGPKHPVRKLTDAEVRSFAEVGFVSFEEYPEGSLRRGRYWTQEELSRVEKGCGGATTMGEILARTYARAPRFYGATYCVHCQKHLPVNEFVWEDGSRVGS